MKVIDFKKSIKDIVEEYPEVVDIMNELGFSEIAKPGMLNTVGRMMTIPKGALMRGISLDKVKEAFKKKGFEIIE